jgi:hypothetical protein
MNKQDKTDMIEYIERYIRIVNIDTLYQIKQLIEPVVENYSENNKSILKSKKSWLNELISDILDDIGENKLCDLEDFQNIDKNNFLSYDGDFNNVFLEKVSLMLKYTFRHLDIKNIKNIYKQEQSHYSIISLLLNDAGYQFIESTKINDGIESIVLSIKKC